MESAGLKFLLLFSLSLLGPSRGQCPSTPGCFGCHPGTTFIVCTGGGLTEFPQLPLDHQTNIETLNLGGNFISYLRAIDLQNFTSLRTLEIQFNNISFIEPGTFSTTTSLASLNLQDNRLSEIPDNLFENTSLSILDLSHNSIESISAATFSGLGLFPTINLEDNEIQTIPSDSFTSLGIINSLSLVDNPLHCDCDLWPFARYLNESTILSLEAGICETPEHVSNTSLVTLEEEEFLCDCSPECVNGTCDMTVGVCECNDGYIGEDCSIPCTAGSFGEGCVETCTCVSEQESSPCDNVDGTCHCLPGYTGDSCELECPEGSYGQDCQEVCQCQNGASCDFINGFCNCTAGWEGATCNTSCEGGYYGRDCRHICRCIQHHESEPCNRVDGRCNCLPMYRGRRCEQEHRTTTMKSTDTLAPTTPFSSTADYKSSTEQPTTEAVDSGEVATTAIVVGASVAFLVLIVVAASAIVVVGIGHTIAKNSHRVVPLSVFPEHNDHSEKLVEASCSPQVEGGDMEPPPPYEEVVQGTKS